MRWAGPGLAAQSGTWGPRPCRAPRLHAQRVLPAHQPAAAGRPEEEPHSHGEGALWGSLQGVQGLLDVSSPDKSDPRGPVLWKPLPSPV